MKKLLVFICMVGISCLHAQEKDNYFSGSLGFDVRNGFAGSKPTNYEKALNWTAEAHVVTENVDFGLGYEAFERLDYSRKFMSGGYHIPVCYIAGTDIKFTVIPSIEFSWIWREWIDNGVREERTFFTPSFNTNLNWDLNDHFAVQLGINGLPRVDKKTVYNEDFVKVIWSNTLKLVVKIPHNKKN